MLLLTTVDHVCLALAHAAYEQRLDDPAAMLPDLLDGALDSLWQYLN